MLEEDLVDLLSEQPQVRDWPILNNTMTVGDYVIPESGEREEFYLLTELLVFTSCLVWLQILSHSDEIKGLIFTTGRVRNFVDTELFETLVLYLAEHDGETPDLNSTRLLERLQAANLRTQAKLVEKHCHHGMCYDRCYLLSLIEVMNVMTS